MAVEERKVFRLGRKEGVAGVSPDWELIERGRSRIVSREWLKDALKAGRLSGIEQVRRTDGDWGPLFGRPVYREVFKRKGLEPRDHAKARARDAIARMTRRTRALLGGAAVCLVAGLPLYAPALLTQIALLAAAGFAVAAGLSRLQTTMAQVELDALKEKLVPPVNAPPPVEDWAWEAARDEVDAYLTSPGESPEGATSPGGTSEPVEECGAASRVARGVAEDGV